MKLEIISDGLSAEGDFEQWDIIRAKVDKGGVFHVAHYGGIIQIYFPSAKIEKFYTRDSTHQLKIKGVINENE